MGTSIGIAHYPEHGRDAQTLVRNADIAMYAAKRNKAGFAIYDPHYDTSQQEHLSLLGELRRAVERNELRLYYQPKVSLHSANVSAVEALMRWEHPQRGLVQPGHVHPVRRAHRLHQSADALGDCARPIRQCGAWLREGLRLQVSVNISARDLMNRDLPGHDRARCSPSTTCRPRCCASRSPRAASWTIRRMRRRCWTGSSALGLQLSIDDYGTGYSSLSYIMRLPVQELKIDRSFISRMVGDDEISTIVRSTIELGHNLGLKVVAEGVEDAVGVEHAADAGLR